MQSILLFARLSRLASLYFDRVRDDHGGGGFCLSFHSGSDYIHVGMENLDKGQVPLQRTTAHNSGSFLLT